MQSISDILNQNSLEKLYLKSSIILFKYEKLSITRRSHYEKMMIYQNHYKSFERFSVTFLLSRY